jgi:hypothetical protein
LSWTKSSAATGDSCHVHSSLPLPTFDQVPGLGYSEVETDMAALQLETPTTALELEMNVAGLKLDTSTTGLELETNIAALELATDTTALDLEMETDMPQGLSKQESYLAD